MSLFKNLLLTVVWLPLILSGQQVSSFTYSAGLGSTDNISGAITNTSVNSACTLTLNAAIPAGRLVTAVEVEYDIQALGFGWISEQRSYLECTTTGTKEASLTTGPPVNTTGTQSYNRSGLTLANGIVPLGGLQFKLHSFRTFGGGGCNTTVQQVPNNSFVVKVTHYPAPSCPPPSSPGQANITANSAQLNWTSGGAGNWQIEYGPQGFSPGTGTLVNVSSNPFVLSGLSPSSFYDWRVRDSCGVGDVSLWSSPGSFQTSCATVSAPFSEDFDGSGWQPPSGFSGIGTIDTCFNRNHQGSFTFETGPPPFPSSFSGPSGDHSSGTGQYIYSEMNSFGGVPDTAVIVSPAIDLSSLNTPQLSFWYHMFGFNIGDLTVYISDNNGSSYNSVFSKSAQQQNAKTDPWQEAVISLASYANKTVLIKFEVVQNTFGTNGDVAIDDLLVDEAPSCPKPKNLQSTLVWHNKIILDWSSGGASHWEIEYGSPGFAPGSGSRVAAAVKPFSLGGLSASTTYDIYLRDSCGQGDVSVWVGPLRVETTCLPATAPYSKFFSGNQFGPGSSFNDTGFIHSCWQRDQLSFYVWKGGPPLFSSFNTGPDVDKTTGTASGKYVYTASLGFGGPTADTTVITTELVDLSALNTPQLSFWYHMFGQNIAGLKVYVHNGHGSWNQLWSVSGQQQSSGADPWKEGIINLAAYSNDTIALRFEALRSGTGNRAEIALDDLRLEEQPSCPKPQNFNIIGYTSNTARFGWTSGGANNWEIEYGSSGFSPGNGTRVAVASNPFTLTGLSANTSYDFYLRDSCGSGDVSVWVGPLNISTNCAPASAPYVAAFDGPAWTVGNFSNPGGVNSCWTRDPGFNYLWLVQSSSFWFNGGPSADHTSGSGKFMMASRISSFNRSLTDVAVLESPMIDLSALTIPELSFWYHMYGSNIDSLTVEVYDGTTYTRVFGLSGQQQNSASAPWLEAIVNLSAYANDTIKLRYKSYSPAGIFNGNNPAIDDVDIHEQPSCPKPANLIATSVGATSVSLNWTSGGASHWELEYGTGGFSPGSGTRVSVSSRPYTLAGLNSATSYQIYLRDSCGVGDVSAWLGPLSITTACLPTFAPYSQNFDGSNWIVGSTFNDTGSIGPCWDRSPLVDYVWKPGPPLFTPFQTGPSADHTSGSGKYIMTESIFGSFTPPFHGYLESPLIALDSLNVPQLVFWYHMYGQDLDSLRVEIDSGNGYHLAQAIIGQQQSSSNDPWQEAILNLSAYSKDTIRVRFVGSKNTFGNRADIAIDDFSVEEAPSCPKPQFLTTQSKSPGSLQLNWNSGGASHWQIEYGPPGFNPGSGTLITVNSKPYTLGGLTANTVYDLYVRDSCGPGDLSAWSSVLTDTTLCNVVIAPFSEDFDGASWPIPATPFDTSLVDACWQRSNRFNYYWRANSGSSPGFNTGPTGDHTTGSAKYIYTQVSSFNTNSTSITSPLIDVSGLSSPELRFWYHMFGSGIDRLETQIWTGQSWQPVDTIVGAQQSASASAWKENVLDLTAFSGDTIQVRLLGAFSGFNAAANIALDDFWIGEAPTCPAPTNLQVNASSTNSVTLSWSGAGATNWQVAYRLSGSSAPLTFLAASSNTNFVVSGLSASSSYDFFVRDSCGLGDVSFWLGPLSATTACGVVSIPWNENFDGAAWQEGTGITNINNVISNCWSRPNGGTPHFGTGQGTTASISTGPNTDASGIGKYIYTEYSGNPTGPGRISTPLIHMDLTSTNPRLVFAYHMYGTGIDSLYIEVNNGSGFQWEYGLVGAQQSSNGAAWLYDTLDLAAYLGDTVQIRFSGMSNSFFGDIALDEVAVLVDSTSCGVPLNFSASGLGTDTASASWTGGGLSSTLELLLLGQARGSGDYFYQASSPLGLGNLQPGSTYLLYLRDSCADGSSSAWLVDTIVTAPCPVVSAQFVSNRSFLSSSFNAGATVNGDSLYWDFGDGNTSSGLNVNHLYSAAGNYQVCLQAYNDCGTADTICSSLEVCDSLIPSFTKSQSGDTLTFDASATRGASGYLWDFGDGNSGSGLNPTHIYSPSNNSRIVTLRVYNNCGDTLSVSKTVSLCQPPLANWTYQIIRTTASGMEVQFDGTLSQNAVSYEWQFGDGATNNTSSQPIHTYLTPGLFYKVTLTVSNNCGDLDFFSYRLSEIGLKEAELAAMIELYPNPTQDRVILRWPKSELSLEEVRLYDNLGREVLSLPAEGAHGEFQLDLLPLAKGSYHLRITTSEGELWQPVVRY